MINTTASSSSTYRLLAGPSPSAGPESLAAHRARLGPMPTPSRGAGIIETLDSAGLLGRGGGGFPVGRKWRSVRDNAQGQAVVLANGAEGEPLAAKDRTLMAYRPHLVLDGCLLAAETVGARRIVLYVGKEHQAAQAGLRAAIAERAGELSGRLRVVDAPDWYVAGEETAAVRFVNSRDARPTTIPPRPFERGVDGRPTLVQNVESLATAALIARRGDGWYREAGRAETRGTALVTVGGAARKPGVREIEFGTPVGELAELSGVGRHDVQAVLLGGYFGGWTAVQQAWDLPLDPAVLRSAGAAFGAGVVSFLATDTCGVVETGRVVRYMADQSARQCGPCEYGLAACADALERLATGRAAADDLQRVDRWSSTIAGRGACKHPDGAVGFLRSGLRTFAEEFALHQRSRRCSRRTVTFGVA